MDNEIVLYPNPSNGIINLESKSEFDLNIVNVLGQKISSLSLNRYNNFKSTVSLNIESGIYFLEIEGVNGSMIVKLLIN